MCPDDDLDAMVRDLFANRNPVREWLEARAAAAAAPPPEPSIIPMPEYSRSPFAPVAVYRCTVEGARCAWSYVVNTALQDSHAPLRIPLPGSGQDISRALTEQAEERMRSLKERIEDAFREHFELFHPGQEPPDQVARLVREETERRRRQEAASR